MSNTVFKRLDFSYELRWNHRRKSLILMLRPDLYRKFKKAGVLPACFKEIAAEQGYERVEAKIRAEDVDTICETLESLITADKGGESDQLIIYGWSMCVKGPVTAYIKKGEGLRRIKSVELAMMAAWRALTGQKLKHEERPGSINSICFYAFPDGHFEARVPGNNCDMGPGNIEMFKCRDRDMSKQLYPLAFHNLDYTVQKLTLIVGLAELCNVIRKAA